MRYSTESFYSKHRVLINISIFLQTNSFHSNTETEAECDFGRVLLQIFMQELFFVCFFFFLWSKWDLTWAPLSSCLCVMDLLQYKNKKGSYKSLQVDRVRRHGAGWLWKQRGICCRRGKKNGEAEECWQPERKRSKEMPRH